MKIGSWEINKVKEREKVICFASGEPLWTFTSKELSLPTESTADKGEVEEIGLPNYSAIDYLAEYEPFIDSATNVFVSNMVGMGYRIKGDSSDKVEELNNKLRMIDFDELLPEIVADLYKYGNAYINLVIEGGQISKLQRIPPHYIKVAKKKKPYFYEYEASAGEKIKIDYGDVIHFKLRGKKDYAYGDSVFSSALELLEDYARMNEQFRILIEDTVAPIMHAKVGGDDILTRPSEEALKSIGEDITKAKKAGVDLITEKFVEIAYIQPDRGLNFQPFIDWFKNKLLMAAMIPETYTMNRSGAAAGGDSLNQIESFNTWIRYIQRTHVEPKINNHLIPMILGLTVYNKKGEKEDLDYNDLPKFEFNETIDWKMKEINYLLKQYNVTLTDDEIRKELGRAPFTEEQRKLIERMKGTKNTGQDFGNDRPNLNTDTETSAEDKTVQVDKGEKKE